MKNKLALKKVGFIYAPILCIFVTGCGDNSLLKAVRNFTTTRVTASKTVTIISEDFYQSCVRKYSSLPIEPIPTILQLQNKLPYDKRIQGLGTCNEQWKIGEDFQKSNDVLLKDMASLEAISSDNVVIFPDTTRDKLLNAINGLPLGNSNDPNISADRQQAVQAGVGILQLISKIFLNKFRQNQLSEVIVNTNDDVQAYILILKKSVLRGYIQGYLQQEQDNIDLQYNLIVTDLLHKEFPNVDPNKPAENLAFDISSPFYSIDNEWREKRAEVDKNIEIGRLYIQFLDEVAQGHNELYILIKGKPPEGLAGNQVTQNQTEKIKQLAQKRLERIQYIAKKLEKKLAK
ncbi:hypothetical protein [Nostoc sp.]|uniref:hypothetical protein n=1 Tax=Nostoc sp. TaxID=1180 RepID=UPI002FF7B52F